jgi:heat shock protein HtpX
LNQQELAGVIAHELAHVKNRDILISTIAAMMAGAITYLTHIALFMGGSRRDDRGGNPLIAILLMVLAPFAAMLIQLAISRSREYQADKAGAELSGSPKSLANALKKLAEGSSRIPLDVSNAQANMFIVQPLTGREMASLFMTHPPMSKRIERLLAMERA